KSLSDSVLPAIYQDSLAIVKSKFSSAIVISLTADGWTNLNNTSFYTVTAHFINNDFHLASLMLECEEFTVQHTGRNIAEWFKFVLERFEISDKIVAITTDNASNMRLAASILKLPHFSGFAHSLKLVVLNAVAKSIKPVVEEVKQTVMHFKKSVLATSKLAEIQKNLNTENIKLKQNTPTQWNSTYDMLNRFYRNNIALRMCIDSLKILQTHHWGTIEQSIIILNPFYEATNTILAEKTVTFSKVGLLIKILKDKMVNFNTQELNNDSKNLVDSLIDGLNDRFRATSNNEITKEAMLLDPRIKNLKESVIAKISRLYGQDSQFTARETESEAGAPVKNSIFSEFIADINQTRELNPRAAATTEYDLYISSNITV
uniref:DUF659 domain-containing protein n=1 Tax=Anopheles funestus TaxID=62324 RepID=A0A182RLZ4_ANOFN